jgi:hypothetical protein
VQCANRFVVTERNDGVIHVAQLDHFVKEGALVMRTLASDGSSAVESLHRMPPGNSLNISLIHGLRGQPRRERVGEGRAGDSEPGVVTIAFNVAAKAVVFG